MTNIYAIIIRVVLWLVLIITAIFSYMAFQKTNANYKAFQDNMYNLLNEHDQQIMLQNEKQFQRLYPYFDSVAKANGIKHITQIHNTEYHNTVDTIIQPLVQPDSTIPYFLFSVDTACFSLAGAVDVPSRSIVFNAMNYDDNITTYYYRQRTRLFQWNWTPHWGRWEYKAKTISNCGDSVNTQNIIIKSTHQPIN